MTGLAKAWLLAAAIVLAAGTGFLTSLALGAGQQAPTTTTTINVATGPTGATGPAGTPGAENCPTGSTFKAVKFIQQGAGPTTLWACVEN